MSALPAPRPAAGRAVAGRAAAVQWAQIRAAAPQVAATIQRYLQRLAAFLAPGSVDAADNALRQFARWMITDAGLDSIAAVRRDDIEDYKVWLAARPRVGGQAITAETHRQRVRTVRAFSGRIIEWDWPDAPPRNPVIAGDIPKKPEPLPKFPGRPRRGQADDRRPGQRRSPRPAGGRAAGPHRHAGRRAGRPGRRRGRADRRRALAADPAGQAPQRPLRPAAPRAGRPARRLDRGQPGAHPPLQAPDRRPPRPAGPLPHRPHRLPRRPGRRGPRRAPPPAAAHAGHPGHQPRHAAGGHRRPARPPQDGDDAHLRQDRQPGRRRRIRRCQRQDRRPLRTATPAARRLREHRHGPAAPRSIRPHARQRPVHPARRTGLPDGIGLRDLRLPILARQRDHARDHGQPDRAALFDGLIQRAQTGPATTGRS